MEHFQPYDFTAHHTSFVLLRKYEGNVKSLLGHLCRHLIDQNIITTCVGSTHLLLSDIESLPCIPDYSSQT